MLTSYPVMKSTHPTTAVKDKPGEHDDPGAQVGKNILNGLCHAGTP